MRRQRKSTRIWHEAFVTLISKLEGKKKDRNVREHARNACLKTKVAREASILKEIVKSNESVI